MSKRRISGGFVTAKGGAVTISEEASRAAADLLGADENTPNFKTTSIPNEIKNTSTIITTIDVEPKRRVSGIFSTARGGAVSISEVAVQKASKLLDSSVTEAPSSSSSDKSTAIPHTIPGTAAVAVALVNYAAITEDLAVQTESSPSKKPCSRTVLADLPLPDRIEDRAYLRGTGEGRRLSGLFSTARGGEVTISTEAAIKAQAQLRGLGLAKIQETETNNSSFDALEYSIEAQSSSSSSSSSSGEGPSPEADTKQSETLPREAEEGLVISLDDSAYSLRSLRLSQNGEVLSVVDAGRYKTTLRSMRARMAVLLEVASWNAVDIAFSDSGQLQLANCSRPLIDAVIDQVLNSKAQDSSSGLREWLALQFRWLVWTFSALERQYPALYFDKLLTRSNLVDAILYRYAMYTNDKEQLAKLSADHALKCLYPPVINRKSATSTVEVTRAPKFSSKRSMSPLQRCIDIQTLVWSLCLCVSIGKEQPDPVVAVTDGWWSAPATLDSHLIALVQQGKIRDGTKIAVFCAGFESSGDSSETTKICLKVNSVRKAADGAKLGFIAPRYLLRGLSVKSALKSGGAIYGVRCRVLGRSATMTRLHLLNANTRITFHLDNEECKHFDEFMDKKRYSIIKNLEKSEELQLNSLLEYLDVEDWMRNVILGIENGDSLEMEEKDCVAVAKTFEALNVAKRDIHKRLLDDELAALQFFRSMFVDILMQCTVSNEIFWLRQSLSDVTSDSDALTIGAIYFITNLSIFNSLGEKKYLSCGKSSSVQFISSGHNSGTQLGQQFIENSVTATYQILRKRFNINDFTSSEITVRCTLVSWTSEDVTTVCDNFFITHLKLFCVDEYRIGFYYTFQIPSFAVGKLPWLCFGQSILIQHAIVRRFDRSNDIIEISRGDHTTVVPIISSIQQVTYTKGIFDDEKARFDAIMLSKDMYNSLTEPGRSYSCARRFFIGAEIVYSSVNQESHFTSLEVCLSNSEVYHMKCCSSILEKFIQLNKNSVSSSTKIFFDCTVVYHESLSVDQDGEILIESHITSLFLTSR